MIFHRSPCVAYRYIIIGGILTFFGSPKQQLKVHHIINDDRALPFILVMVPRADNAGFGFEPGGKCACRLQQNFFVAFVLRQAITVSKDAIHLEAHVVSAAVHLFLFQDIGMLLRLLFPEIILGILIEKPELAGEESAGPVFGRDEVKRPVRFRIPGIGEWPPSVLFALRTAFG